MSQIPEATPSPLASPPLQAALRGNQPGPARPIILTSHPGMAGQGAPTVQ